MEWQDIIVGMRCSIRRRPWLRLFEYDASPSPCQWSDPISGTVVDIDIMEGVGVVAVGIVAEDDGLRYKVWRAKGQKTVGVFRNMDYSYKRFGYVRVMLCDPSEDKPPRRSMSGRRFKKRQFPPGI